MESPSKAGWYRVTGKAGSLARTGKAMDSERVRELPNGTVVRVAVVATLDSGKERARLSSPVDAWITFSKGLEPCAAPAEADADADAAPPPPAEAAAAGSSSDTP